MKPPVTAKAKFRRRIDLLAAPAGVGCSNYEVCSMRSQVKEPVLSPVGPIRPKPAQYSFEAKARKEKAELKAKQNSTLNKHSKCEQHAPAAGMFQRVGAHMGQIEAA